MKHTFTFLFPITQQKEDVHRERRMTFEHVGDLQVKGDFSKEEAGYDYRIKSITFEGMNIWPLVESFTSMEQICAACTNHILGLLESHDFENASPVISMRSSRAKLVSLHAGLKVKSSC